MLNRLVWTAAFGLFLLGAGSNFAPRTIVAAEDRSAAPIAPADLPVLHALIKPHKDEAPWSTIPWLTDVWEARRRAAREGKPIFAWLPAGEPLGCT
jgi:hypothetical protein